jgi:NhaD family Na+/H+ antiporter
MEHIINLTNHWAGFSALLIFIVAYGFVMAEEFTHLRKSKPVVLAAGLIWGIVAFVYSSTPHYEIVAEEIRHSFLEYAELAFFLLVAMTYINALEERNVFNSLKSWLIKKQFSYRQLFWITGVLAFFLSPLADNLTTALVLCAVVLAVGSSSPQFVGLACINIVVAANAGGAFSPFGDITTLMVWQAGQLEFAQFFILVIPSVVNYIIPAGVMHFFVSNHKPEIAEQDIPIKFGGRTIIVLGLLTILTAVSFHNFLHLPPVFGMMTGLAYLQLYGYYIKRKTKLINEPPYDFFENVARVEWDTLLFFFGVILAVGGLGFIGYLEYVSAFMYTDLGATNANILVGILSAIVDNIPVMFAVLTMDPTMPDSQWLLVTLTAGVGGSMLSIGSAAGVALMGQSKGMYTFFGHLKWTPVIALGYFASIYTHILLNF